MEKKIKRKIDLPNWFDLKKYATAELLDAAGWYEQLSIRRELIKPPFGSIRVESIRREGPPLVEENARRLVALIRDTPIVNIEGDDLLRLISCSGVLHELKTRNPKSSFGVRFTTVREHYITEHFIERDKRTYARNYFNEYFYGNSSSTLPLVSKDWFEKPVDGVSNHPFYDINIRANTLLPDSVLIAQFGLLLKNWRRATTRLGLKNEKVRDPNFSDWVRFGVLPYLDLVIWQQETGVKITNRVMANTIFPPGEGGEEVVRKTTAKLVDDLLTLKHLETLAAIAAYELAERQTP